MSVQTVVSCDRCRLQRLLGEYEMHQWEKDGELPGGWSEQLCPDCHSQEAAIVARHNAERQETLAQALREFRAKANVVAGNGAPGDERVLGNGEVAGNPSMGSNGQGGVT